DERQAIFKAIFDLKQEVDALKARLDRRELPPPPAVPLSQEAEWQEQEPLPAEPQHTEPEAADLSIRRTEEDLILQALAKHGGNRKKAAEELGVSERTIYRRLESKKK
ncbi:MAG: helix-turn-helix domain-containing protein, partial [Bacteroidales bacterium]|nr:helix-turn-helix domain-containing protein [Bacteroidales bacterium]